MNYEDPRELLREFEDVSKAFQEKASALSYLIERVEQLLTNCPVRREVKIETDEGYVVNFAKVEGRWNLFLIEPSGDRHFLTNCRVSSKALAAPFLVEILETLHRQQSTALAELERVLEPLDGNQWIEILLEEKRNKDDEVPF